MKVRILGATMLPLIVLAMLMLPEGEPPRANAQLCSPGGVCYGYSKKKGFDTCDAPSTSVMTNWWTSSPYWDIGIYIGGSNRACSPQTNLNSAWVQTVNSYGWDYYLTWVGPQAQCATGGPYSTYIDNNTTTAFNQGKSEALGTINAALGLVIYGSKIYYYDLERYDSTNTTCRNAVKAFLDGWGYELRVVGGEKVGVYGHSRNATDWASVPNVPDDVWVADWNWDWDVWGLNGLNNGLWYNSQRLHQLQKYPYTNSHNETWGPYTVNVDNDCAMGYVTPNGHFYEDTACTVE